MQDVHDAQDKWDKRDKRIARRVIRSALLMVRRDCTVREVARYVGVGKSTTFKDVTERLEEINPSLAVEVQRVLCRNLKRRARRGGLTTQRKWKLGAGAHITVYKRVCPTCGTKWYGGDNRGPWKCINADCDTVLERDSTISATPIRIVRPRAPVAYCPSCGNSSTEGAWDRYLSVFGIRGIRKRYHEDPDLWSVKPVRCPKCKQMVPYGWTFGELGGNSYEQ